jgi:hypothetical protein
MMDVSESFHFILNCYNYYHRKLFKVVPMCGKDLSGCSKKCSLRAHVEAVICILINLIAINSKLATKAKTVRNNIRWFM